jgi:hypothetical protein
MFGPLEHASPGEPSRCSHFFRLTAARNGRIPVVPQPRIEGRGCHARVRVCGPTSHNPWTSDSHLNYPGWE